MSTLPLLPGNPVYGEGFAASTVSAGPALAWSGSMSEDLSAPDPRNWMRPGRTKLDELCAGAKDVLQEAGTKILLVPHARHILSDAPSAIAWHRDHMAMGVFGLAVAPALLLDPDHAPTGGPLEDLMFRIHELLAPVVDRWIEPPTGVMAPAVDPELVAGLQSRFPAGQPTM